MKEVLTMTGTVNGFDYMNMKAQEYWSFPSSYSMEKRKEQLDLLLYSNDFVASEKKDGYWEMFIKDDNGDLTMRARNEGTKGWVCKQDWVPHLHSFFDEIPNGTVLIGEVYIPEKTSKTITTILGCGLEKALDRQKSGEKLRYSIFDILAYDGTPVHQLPISERITYLNKLRPEAEKHEYVSIVTYWDNPTDIRENWLRILSDGGEGVVMTRKDNPYSFGKRTARTTLKLKKELQETIDVFLTGRWKEARKEYTGTELESWLYWYDEVNQECVYDALHERVHTGAMIPVTKTWFNGWAGSIEIATILNGKVTPIGYISGITEEVRQGIVENNEYWKGKVVELQAMEIAYVSGIPALRHAKIVNWRMDKSWKDCEWKG